MLDDLKYIHQRDGQDALGVAERQAAQLKYEFGVPDLKGNYKNVVFVGMGGSALPALFAQVWPGVKLPFEVVRGYHVPAYVDNGTLFIACSYSGNTEETLSALAEAEKAGAKIVTMAGGGKLKELADAGQHTFILIPKAEQPRYAVLYMLKAIESVFKTAGLAPEQGKQITEGADFLAQAVKAWLPTIPADKNPAKKLAMDLAGNSLVVYGGPLMSPAVYKWKINANENAKNVAWWNQLSEFDHNELIGWTSHPVQKPYAVVELRSNLEHPRIQRRFEVAEKLLSGRRPAPHVVNVQGEDLLEQLLWALGFGDFVTIYLALLNGVNPAPVDFVEKFKKELG